MLCVLSPSKTLNFEDKSNASSETIPLMLKDSVLLIKELRKYPAKRLGKLMGISDKLAELNARRNEQFNPRFTNKNAKQALTAFKGDVYAPMDVDHYKAADFEFAQQHLRILSGLYGLLRPLDLIQPYRLEMGTALKNPRGKDLYSFWGNSITEAIEKELKEHKNKILINLASVEYFHSVKPLSSGMNTLNVHFKEKQKGGLKVIGLFAKKARGMMADFMIKNRIDEAEGLKDFNGGGYRFEPSLSDKENWLFIR